MATEKADTAPDQVPCTRMQHQDRSPPGPVFPWWCLPGFLLGAVSRGTQDAYPAGEVVAACGGGPARRTRRRLGA